MIKVREVMIVKEVKRSDAGDISPVAELKIGPQVYLGPIKTAFYQIPHIYV